MNVKRKKTYLLALVPFIVLTAMFEVLPVLSIIVKSVLSPGGTGGVTFAHYVDIFSKKLYQSAILNSVLIAIASSVIGIVIAFLGAKAAHNTTGTMKAIFMSILNMVSNFSGVPLAFAYIILFGNVGVMTMIGSKLGIEALANFPLYSVWGLLFIYIYFQIPLATLLLIPSFESIRKEWKEAIALLGGGSFTFWIKVGIPVLLPSILGTFSVLFSNAIAAYATAYALLMNNISLLPIRISEQFVGDIVQRPEFGSALAVVLMVLMVIALVIQNKVTKGKGGAVCQKK